VVNLTSEQLSRIVNIVLASSKLKEIHLPHMTIRANLHLLIWGDVGIGKSTILKEIGENMDVESVRGLTPAVMLGAVDKSTGEFLEPITWTYRNKVILLDEYHIEKFDKKGREVLNEMLKLMEHPRYIKKVGYRCNEIEEVEDDLYLRVKSGKIACNTRFSMVIDTMMNITKKKQLKEIEALASRCLTIYLAFSFEELRKIAMGKVIYSYSHIKLKKDIVKINKKTYAKIESYAGARKNNKSRYFRLLGDLCRIYAVIGKIDHELFNLICDLSEE